MINVEDSDSDVEVISVKKPDVIVIPDSPPRRPSTNKVILETLTDSATIEPTTSSSSSSSSKFNNNNKALNCGESDSEKKLRTTSSLDSTSLKSSINIAGSNNKSVTSAEAATLKNSENILGPSQSSESTSSSSSLLNSEPDFADLNADPDLQFLVQKLWREPDTQQKIVEFNKSVKKFFKECRSARPRSILPQPWHEWRGRKVPDLRQDKGLLDPFGWDSQGFGLGAAGGEKLGVLGCLEEENNIVSDNTNNNDIRSSNSEPNNKHSLLEGPLSNYCEKKDEFKLESPQFFTTEESENPTKLIRYGRAALLFALCFQRLCYSEAFKALASIHDTEEGVHIDLLQDESDPAWSKLTWSNLLSTPEYTHLCNLEYARMKAEEEERKRQANGGGPLVDQGHDIEDNLNQATTTTSCLVGYYSSSEYNPEREKALMKKIQEENKRFRLENEQKFHNSLQFRAAKKAFMLPFEVVLPEILRLHYLDRNFRQFSNKRYISLAFDFDSYVANCRQSLINNTGTNLLDTSKNSGTSKVLYNFTTFRGLSLNNKINLNGDSHKTYDDVLTTTSSDHPPILQGLYMVEITNLGFSQDSVKAYFTPVSASDTGPRNTNSQLSGPAVQVEQSCKPILETAVRIFRGRMSKLELEPIMVARLCDLEATGLFGKKEDDSSPKSCSTGSRSASSYSSNTPSSSSSCYDDDDDDDIETRPPPSLISLDNRRLKCFQICALAMNQLHYQDSTSSNKNSSKTEISSGPNSNGNNKFFVPVMVLPPDALKKCVLAKQRYTEKLTSTNQGRRAKIRGQPEDWQQTCTFLRSCGPHVTEDAIREIVHGEKQLEQSIANKIKANTSIPPQFQNLSLEDMLRQGFLRKKNFAPKTNIN